MVILDGTIVLVALPSIGADLGFSEQGLQWVLSAYGLTFGGLLFARTGGRPPASRTTCGKRRCEPARRAERGLPVRFPGRRRAGRDRHGAGAPAPRPPVESAAGAARGRPGSHPETTKQQSATSHGAGSRSGPIRRRQTNRRAGVTARA